mmetsp:Transcript_37697/g.88186  ORF Transcript_37697/g.88186 Transcript_37697/m.88186 type:complete len:202 (-) Transcript_37697:90-695(-)
MCTAYKGLVPLCVREVWQKRHECASALTNIRQDKLLKKQHQTTSSVSHVGVGVRGINVHNGARGYGITRKHVVLDGGILRTHRRERRRHGVKGWPPYSTHRGHECGRCLELLVHLDDQGLQRWCGSGRLDFPAREADPSASSDCAVVTQRETVEILVDADSGARHGGQHSRARTSRPGDSWMRQPPAPSNRDWYQLGAFCT